MIRRRISGILRNISSILDDLSFVWVASGAGKVPVFLLKRKFQSMHTSELIRVLEPLYTPQRFEKFQKIAAGRSRQVACILENTHHAHNMSAILRTMESFGFLDVLFLYTNEHIRFRVADNVDRKASQWLLPARHTNAPALAQRLKDLGYNIGLVTLPTFARTGDQVQWERVPSFSTAQFSTPKFLDFMGQKPLALVFGGEALGVSSYWHDQADAYLYVEMKGFTESLNISVCAGLILGRLREELEKSGQLALLTLQEQTALVESWLCQGDVSARKLIARQAPELLPLYEERLSKRTFLERFAPQLGRTS
jgi:tRNA (guanosine-2'-O-)-methyltransferase